MWEYVSWSRIELFEFFKTQRLCDFDTFEKCVGTLSERLRRQIRNLLGFARAGSNPAGVVLFNMVKYHNYRSMVQWPSGLRRSTQVRVSSEAWVRTPHQSFLVFSFFEVVPLLFLGYEVFEKFFEQTKSTATRNRTGDLPRVRRSS